MMYQAKEKKTSRGLVRRTAFVSFLGGCFLALMAWSFHNPTLALGFFLGSLVALLSLYGLKWMTEKILDKGQGKGKTYFWIFYSARWFFFAGILWLLLQISVPCFWGALGSYVWFLVVLTWTGLRYSETSY
jgi:hypothetical protein